MTAPAATNRCADQVVSESGVQALGQLKVGYSALSDKLDIAYVRVRKPDGTVITAQESPIQDLTFPDAPVYTDYHEKHISVPSLRPGDVLEYQLRPHHRESAGARTILDQLQLRGEAAWCWTSSWRSMSPKTARSY